jgi:hypothetical protein
MRITIYPNSTPGRTRQQNGAEAIRVAANQNADYVLKLEDDIDFIGDFLGSVGRFLERYGSEVPMISFASSWERLEDCHYADVGESVLGPGTSFPNVRRLLGGGHSFVPRLVTHGFCFAQALAWPTVNAQHLERWLGPDPFVFDGRKEYRGNCHDFKVAEWGRHLGPDTMFGYSIPSFVQHLGRESAIARGSRIRKHPLEFPWPGRTWTYA